MNVALAFALALPFGGPPQDGMRERPRDAWFGIDKAKHFVVSAVIQGAGHSVLRANGYDHREAAWTAAAFTLSVGVGKEMWDASRGRIFSWKDLAADGAGGVTGAVIVRQVHY